MNGFIFGFQRLVWCPKCTPASKSSGTNSTVFAIQKCHRERGGAADGKDATSMPQSQLQFRPSFRYCAEALPGATRSSKANKAKTKQQAAEARQYLQNE